MFLLFLFHPKKICCDEIWDSVWWFIIVTLCPQVCIILWSQYEDFCFYPPRNVRLCHWVGKKKSCQIRKLSKYDFDKKGILLLYLYWHDAQLSYTNCLIASSVFPVTLSFLPWLKMKIWLWESLMSLINIDDTNFSKNFI